MDRREGENNGLDQTIYFENLLTIEIPIIYTVFKSSRVLDV